MNSSKIILNTSANFSSLRIENPKKASLNEETAQNLKQLIHNIPELNQYFTIQNQVGEGTFSKVYKAKHNQSQENYALKCIIPTIKATKILPELRFLRDIGGDSNIIEIKTCLFGSGYTIIVMPYFPHDKFYDYVKDMSLEEIKDYIKNLLIALKKIHSAQIIHRDIKPNNFLYNRKERKYALVDFGLAQTHKDIVRTYKTIMKSGIHIKNKIKSQDVSKECSKLTSNSIIGKYDSKMVCVRKRLLIENDDENIIPPKIKKSKFDLPNKNSKSSVFNTPPTPCYKAMQNMTNFQPNQIVSPLVFNVIPDLDFNLNIKCINNNLSPIKQQQNDFMIDPFKTPTKRNSVLGQIQNSPNSLIIPETPPKSAKLSSEVRKKIKLNSPIKCNLSITSNTPTNNIKQQPTTPQGTCKCFGYGQICKVCIKKPDCMAPRAGTPGFRAPEVLLRYLCQTTAIDIWSCGVIFASLLSKRYPFFRNTDDMTSLAEITSIFGTKRIQKAAQSIGKAIVTSEKNLPPINLKETFTQLRGDNLEIDDSAFNLLDRLLDPNPNTRITAQDALSHPFFDGIN